MSAPELTHFRDGLPRMVDVTGKVATARAATAEAWVRLPAAARAALEVGTNPKGDPLIVARLAGLAHPVGVLVLMAMGGPGAAAFALLHGAGNGIMTIPSIGKTKRLPWT